MDINNYLDTWENFQSFIKKCVSGGDGGMLLRRNWSDIHKEFMAYRTQIEQGYLYLQDYFMSMSPSGNPVSRFISRKYLPEDLITSIIKKTTGLPLDVSLCIDYLMSMPGVKQKARPSVMKEFSKKENNFPENNLFEDNSPDLEDDMAGEDSVNADEDLDIKETIDEKSDTKENETLSDAPSGKKNSEEENSFLSYLPPDFQGVPADAARVFKEFMESAHFLSKRDSTIPALALCYCSMDIIHQVFSLEKINDKIIDETLSDDDVKAGSRTISIIINSFIESYYLLNSGGFIKAAESIDPVNKINILKSKSSGIRITPGMFDIILPFINALYLRIGRMSSGEKDNNNERILPNKGTTKDNDKPKDNGSHGVRPNDDSIFMP